MSKSENLSHPEFREAFLLIHQDQKKFLKWLKSKPFDLSEKKLLTALYYFKKNKKHSSWEIVSGSPIQDSFLEGVRLYLKGLIYNQHGHLGYAIEHLNKSLEVFAVAHEEKFIINPLCALALAYGNRRELKEMAGVVDQILSIKTESKHAYYHARYCQVLYLNLNGELPKANRILNDLLHDNDLAVLPFKPFLEVIAFGIAIRQSQFSSAYEILESYKDHGGTVVKANYAYMKLLLEHLDKQAPLYVYAHQFADFPELHHQLEVIKALSIGDLNQAKLFWGKLAAHNSQLYGQDFKYEGEENLFSLSLARYQVHTKTPSWNRQEIKNFDSRLERLHYILSHAESPVASDQLVELIWEEEWNEMTSARLRKLISLYQKKYQAQVISRQLTYQLKKSAS